MRVDQVEILSDAKQQLRDIQAAFYEAILSTRYTSSLDVQKLGVVRLRSTLQEYLSHIMFVFVSAFD
jgi:hypothetical protein